MTRTLYGALTNVESPVTYSQAQVSEEQRRILDGITTNLVATTKRKIMDDYASRHESIQCVIEGQRTFYQMGEPIIAHCKSLEEGIATKKFARISKTQILGLDSRDDSQVAEEVNYLINEEIIDPQQYFSSQRIFPKSFTRVGKRINEFNFKHFGKFIIAGFSLPLLTGTYCLINPVVEITTLKELNMPLNFAIGMVGSLAVWSAAFLPGIYLEGRNVLTQQRQEFEKALNYLDNEVKELFPLNQNKREKIEQLEAAVA